MTQNVFRIFAVSDATGELAHNLALATARQFEDIKVDIVRKGRVQSDDEIREVISEAKHYHGAILFTFVSEDVRRRLLSEAKKEHVIAMDVMGPVLDMMSHFFHQLPSNEPGLQYKDTRDYFKRMEAIEFAVRHDEGTGLHNIDHADIILLGISRCSKTPLAMYLAYKGYRCANIPIVHQMPLPDKLAEVDKKKIFGLTISIETLMARRSTRMKSLGRPTSEHYAQKENIEEELNYAQKVYEGLGGVKVVDISGKAIEEIAAEILHEMSVG